MTKIFQLAFPAAGSTKRPVRPLLYKMSPWSDTIAAAGAKYFCSHCSTILGSTGDLDRAESRKSEHPCLTSSVQWQIMLKANPKSLSMLKRFLLPAVMFAVLAGSNVIAQPPRISPGGTSTKHFGKLGNKEYEGVIWEFKAIDPATKKTEKTGRFRVKEDALFLVQVKEVESEKGKDAVGKPDAKDAGGLRKALTKKIEETAKADPTVRIGEIDYESRTDPGDLRLIFDKDDKYELSGRAVISRTS